MLLRQIFIPEVSLERGMFPLQHYINNSKKRMFIAISQVSICSRSCIVILLNCLTALLNVNIYNYIYNYIYHCIIGASLSEVNGKCMLA